MTSAAKNLLVLCLFSLSTAVLAHASEYPFAPGSVDISVNNISFTTNGSGASESLNLTGSSVKLPDGSTLAGAQVMTIEDLLGTPSNGIKSSIDPALSFTANASGFTITGQSVEDYNRDTYTGPITYLSGTFVPGSFLTDNGGDYGELFDVTTDNVAEWTALEWLEPNPGGAGSATSLLGDQIALDFDSVGGGGTADMEPWTETSPTPEPATLTLLCSGLAAGLIRKRLARKKA